MSSRSTGMFAAAVFAAVTLVVFGTLQGYGPGSAIRRFHHAVETNDIAEIQRTVKARAGGRDLVDLISRVQALQSAGATYQIAKMDRSDRDVRAAVVYKLPHGERMAMVWVAVHDDGDVWRVDAHQTISILRGAMGF